MKKTLRKIIAFVLVLTLSVSMFAVVFSAFAADADTSAVTVPADDSEEEEHTTYLQLFIDFFKSIFAFFKYIFYDVYLGKPAPEIPNAPRGL